MSWRAYDTGPIRLSPYAPRWRRPGQACPDATVAEARRMVETSSASLSHIARVVGVTTGTVSRWALNGSWARPVGAPPWSSRYDGNGWCARRPRLFDARRALREAEGLLRALEAAAPPAPEAAGPALDRLATALAALDEAARATRRRAPRQPQVRAPPQLSSSMASTLSG